MNCTKLLAAMGFRCREVSEKLLRVWSPFTYGNDGEVVGFYVEETAHARYRVTDGAESLRHAASMGVNLSRSRVGTLQEIAGDTAHISSGGEISATADESSLAAAIAAVLNAALAVSHMELRWMPRSPYETFTAEVGERLERDLPDRVKRNVVVTGGSGHQIEIPFAVSSGNRDTYIQPVAYGDGRVNWDNVYRAFGKMVDLRSVNATDDQRIVVVDDRDAQEDLSQSITFLSASAGVVRYSSIDKFVQKLAA